jgi:hypothetical protein
VEDKVRELDEPVGDILDNDLIHTNPTACEDLSIAKSRFIKETRTYVNIDSRDRKLWKEELVHPDGKTLEELNLERDNDELYFQKGGLIYKKCYNTPSDYEINFPVVYNNVKSVRLISTEIPNPNLTVNKNNNIILIDIIDDDIELSNQQQSLCITKSIPLKDECRIPFFLIKLPTGNYNLDELVEMIEREVNQEIEQKSEEGFKDLFKITGNAVTGVFSISINQPCSRNLKFHWRFWFTPGIPECQLLYYALGYPKPYERNRDGTNRYTEVYDNLVKEENKLKHYGLTCTKPYRHINLNGDTYIYLVIEGMRCLLDLKNPSLDIFAKVQTPKGTEILFNTFVPTFVFYTEVIKSLDKLKIKWVDRYGNLVDFQSLDHTFTLEITQYLDELSANNFSSVRGVTDQTSFTSKERIYSYRG